MKKTFLSSVLVLGILALVGVGVVSAHGWFGGFGNATPEEIAEHQTQMFEHKAELLGLSIDVIKNGWAQGKNLLEIAEENGITQEQLQTRMQEERKVQLQEHLQILVQQGVITQSQADQRLQFMEEHMGEGGFGRGMHKGFGWRSLP
jgi:hypothetical protein